MPKTDVEKEVSGGGGDPIIPLTSTSKNPQIEKPLTKPDIVKEINEKEKYDDMEKKSAKKEKILESSTKGMCGEDLEQILKEILNLLK